MTDSDSGENFGQSVEDKTNRLALQTSVCAPGYRGFLAFCESVDFAVEPYMKRIAKVFFGPARQVAMHRGALLLIAEAVAQTPTEVVGAHLRMA